MKLLYKLYIFLFVPECTKKAFNIEIQNKNIQKAIQKHR